MASEKTRRGSPLALREDRLPRSSLLRISSKSEATVLVGCGLGVDWPSVVVGVDCVGASEEDLVAGGGVCGEAVEEL